ncbi:MAG TPA: hypothetical protein VK203_11880, partial [Nostocaceae cyanobacterium]|nr:hypothetical protein [Nostocaceae cyanobacterium]
LFDHYSIARCGKFVGSPKYTYTSVEVRTYTKFNGYRNTPARRGASWGLRMPDVYIFTVSVDAGAGPVAVNWRPVVVSYIAHGNDHGWYYQAGGGWHAGISKDILKFKNSASATIGVNVGWVFGSDPSKIDKTILNGWSKNVSVGGGNGWYGGFNISWSNYHGGKYVTFGAQIGGGEGAIQINYDGTINTDAVSFSNMFSN